MTSTTRSNTTTALAVAITAALFAAPAYAQMRTSAAKVAPAKVAAAKGPVFSKPGVPYGTNLKAPAEQRYDSFIVSFKKGIKPASDQQLQRNLDAVGKMLNARIAIQRTQATGAKLVRLDREIGDVERKMLEAELMKRPDVRAVEPNGRVYRAFEPNDPLFPQQWHYQGDGMGINATEAWDSADGTGVVVAVLDTGQVNHADLQGQFTAGYDFISDPANARDGDGYDDDPNDEGDWDDKYDSSWHGTHVAGTVAARTDNNLGVAGVAHGAKVQHVRVLGNQGGAWADLNDAIVWAAGGSVPGQPDNPTPARIINMSLGGGTACPADMQDAIDIANDLGAMVVVAAGNASTDIAGYAPAGCEGVVPVAGTGPNNTRYTNTNYGTTIKIAAPAGSGVAPETDQVLSTLNTGTEGQEDDSYAWYAGTSMAAPHVAGTAALVLEMDPDLTKDEVEEILHHTAWASNETVANCDNSSRWCGSLIDAGLAVAVASGEEPLPPTPPGPPAPPPPTPLTNGEVVELDDMAAGTDLFFTLEVPAGQGDVTFDLIPGTGATGDSDIYVRYGAPPTNATYDCRPWTGGVVAEECSFDNPQAGTWHVRVVAYSSSTNWTLVGEYGGTGDPDPDPPADAIELENDVTVTGISVGTGEEALYFIDVPEGATDLTVELEGAAGGDADLYVAHEQVPTNSLYDCRSWTVGNNELCTFPTPEAGQWFVRVHGYAAATGLSLTASFTGGETPVDDAPQNLEARYVFPIRGQRIRVPLMWDGGEGAQVDVRFNGQVAATVTNTGSFTHTFRADSVGAGTATYQVCNAGTNECSAEITVDYTARR